MRLKLFLLSFLCSFATLFANDKLNNELVPSPQTSSTLAVMDAFILTFETDGPNRQVQIGVNSSFTYNYTVDWGDGSAPQNYTGNATYFYTTAGTYDATITGIFPAIDMVASGINGAARNRLVDVKQWGTNQWQTFNRSFAACQSLFDFSATDTPDLSMVTDLSLMFSSAAFVGDLNDWDVSTVTTLLRFASNGSANPEISGWDISNVTTLAFAFQNNTTFNRDISNWNTTNVESFRDTFNGAISFDQNLGGWSTASLTTNNGAMLGMFLNVTLSTANYDATLIGWATQPDADIPTGTAFNGGNSMYCESGTERTFLFDVKNWRANPSLVIDGGQDCTAGSFVTTWTTESNNLPIEIGTFPGATYDYTIDWGDGSPTEIYTGNALHFYATAGSYDVLISGAFPAIYMQDSGILSEVRDRLTDVKQWGDNTWETMEGAFFDTGGLGTLSATDEPNLSQVTSMEKMFNASTVSGGLDGFDTSNVTNMRQVFAVSTFNGDISGWDTSNVTIFNRMFENNRDFNGDITNWDTGSADQMIFMFRNAFVFNQDIGDWDTAAVTSMRDMFNNARAFDQDLGNWNILNLINNSNSMQGFLLNATLSTANYDATLAGWLTLADANPADFPIGLLFTAGNSKYCTAEQQRNDLMNVYNWVDTATVPFDGGFGCDILVPFITEWTTDIGGRPVTIGTDPSLNYNYIVDWGDGSSTESFTGNANHIYSAAGSYQVSIIGTFPALYMQDSSIISATRDRLTDVVQWGDNTWETMAGAFFDTGGLGALSATDEPDLSGVTSMEKMFTASTVSGGLDGFDTSNVTNMKQAFAVSTFNGDISGWDTSNVTIFNRMFENNRDFNGNITNWDTGSADQMVFMFRNAFVFNQDIGDWDTAAVTSMRDMFNNARAFDQDLGNWNILNLINNSNSMQGFLLNATLSNANYDATLAGWLTLADANPSDFPIGLLFTAGNSKYCTAEQQRNDLMNVYNWVDTATVPFDGGFGCDILVPFITEWTTEANSLPIIIGTFPGLQYNYTVDWGDGSTAEIFTGNATHTYATAGAYDVSITGTFPTIYMEDSSILNTTRDRMTDVKQWGDNTWATMEGAFFDTGGLGNLSATDEPDMSEVTSMEKMFSASTVSGGLDGFDTSNVTDMAQTFAVSTFNGDISGWDTSNVTRFNRMFQQNRIFNSDITNWDTGSATQMIYMFTNARAFNQDIGDWDTADVTSMRDMFNNAFAFDQDLGDWNILSIENNTNSMQGFLLNGELSTENYDATLAGWIALADANPTEFPVGILFSAGNSEYCLAEQQRNDLINVYNWVDTPFFDGGEGCPNTPFITTWSTSVDMRPIEIGTLPSLDYDYMVDWGDGSPAENFTANATHTYAIAGSYDVSITGDFPALFMESPINSSVRDRLVDVKQWGDNEWESMQGAFFDTGGLAGFTAVDTPDLSNVENFRNIFNASLFGGDLDTWDVSTVTNMYAAFANSTYNGNIANWDVSNVTDFNYMFFNNTGFDSDITNWNPASAVRMRSMFQRATVFNQDIGDWGTSTIITMRDMFNGAVSFNQELGDWNLSSIISNGNAMQGFLQGGALNTQNYDDTLIGWRAQITAGTTFPSNILFTAGFSTYCDSEVERDYFMDTLGWIGTSNVPFDGGQAVNCATNSSLPLITVWNIASDNETLNLALIDADGVAFVDWGDGTTQQFSGNNPDVDHTYATAGLYNVAINSSVPIRLVLPKFANTQPQIALVDVSQWGDLQYKSNKDMFKVCPNVNISATDVPDLSNSISTSGMFSSSTNFNSDISAWDMSNVRFINTMFRDAVNFNQDISSWDVSSATLTAGMFGGATSFNQDVSGWDVSNVTDFRFMFASATAFDQDLSDWDISGLTQSNTMQSMLDDSGMSTANYDATLLGWSTLDAGETVVPMNVSLGAVGVEYCDETGYDALIALGWTINDAGQDPACAPINIADGNAQNNRGQSTSINVGMYPNPATNNVTVTDIDGSSLEQVTIYDVTGRIVLEISVSDAHSTTFDVSGLQQATYVMVISSEKGLVTKQLIKE